MTTFWHKISIDWSVTEYSRTVDIVRFFLERDPAAPFSFYMRAWNHHFMDEADDHIRQVMEMLADQSTRWENVEIKLEAQHLLPLIQIKNRLPLLQELHFSTQSYPVDISEELYDIFQNAPSLAIVRINTLHLGWKLDPSNLKELRVCSPRSGAFIALRQMTKLERLELDPSDSWCLSDQVISSSPIVLPKLTKLICAESYWLEFMETPSLEELSIQGFKSTHVLSFLSRSSCNLNISRLHISYTRKAAIIIDIIKNTPRITYLRLEGIPHTHLESVLQQLIIPTNSREKVLAPHLQSLHISHSFFHDTFLCDLISSRTDSSTDQDHCNHKKLQELIIDNAKGHVPTDIALLCSERGVKLLLY